MKFIKGILFVIVWFLAPPLASAALTSTDESEQTVHLEILSDGWVPPIVYSANTIFAKPEYTAADWEDFFNKYFNCLPSCAGNSATRHSLTDDLSNYLHYPLFWWFDNTVHSKLQMGLINPLWTKISTILSAHPTDLGQTLFNDLLLRQTLFNSHSIFAHLAKVGVVDAATRTNVYNNYKAHITAYPQYFSDATTIDNTAYPFVAFLRSQVWASFGDSLPMTAAIKSEIATTIDFGHIHPRKLDIWNTFTVLVMDNNGLDLTQLNLIYDILGGIPKALHHLRYVTVRDFFMGSTNEEGPWLVTGGTGAVNIFGSEMGISENGFPSDISPADSDLFSIVVVHEFNHVVNAFNYDKLSRRYLNNPVWANRQDQLITQAGSVPLQYLRSQVAEWECTGDPNKSFFQECPQEFFASISNQYFTDSWHTLNLGLSRFDRGYKEPINQFLFFADTYTDGGSSTKIYTLNTSGMLTVTDAPVTRDARGRITEIFRADTNKVYRFTLDDSGNVTAYTVVDRPLPDLVMTALSTKKRSVRVGKSLSLSNVVQNHGNAHAGAFAVKFVLSTNTIIGDADDRPLTGQKSVRRLDAGSRNKTSTKVRVPTGTPPGDYFIGAIADMNNTVTERNEGNNTLLTTATINVEPAGRARRGLNLKNVPIP